MSEKRLFRERKARTRDEERAARAEELVARASEQMAGFEQRLQALEQRHPLCKQNPRCSTGNVLEVASTGAETPSLQGETEGETGA